MARLFMDDLVDDDANTVWLLLFVYESKMLDTLVKSLRSSLIAVFFACLFFLTTGDFEELLELVFFFLFMSISLVGLSSSFGKINFFSSLSASILVCTAMSLRERGRETG